MDDQERGPVGKLVADFESSDLTQREFATERGVSFSNLRNWLYRLRKESRPLVADETKQPDQVPARDAAGEGPRLVPVRVVASAAKPRNTHRRCRRQTPRTRAAVGHPRAVPARHGCGASEPSPRRCSPA